MSDLRERLRYYGYPAYEPFCKTSNDALEALEAKDRVIDRLRERVAVAMTDDCQQKERIEELEAALPVDYWEQNCLLREKQERIEQLEAALRWEAGEECLHAFDGVDCINKHGPESPDLWCTYCRITNVIKGDNDE